MLHFCSENPVEKFMSSTNLQAFYIGDETNTNHYVLKVSVNNIVIIYDILFLKRITRIQKESYLRLFHNS